MLSQKKQQTQQEKQNRRKLQKDQKAAQKAKKIQAKKSKQVIKIQEKKQKNKQFVKVKNNYDFPQLKKPIISIPKIPQDQAVLITSALPYVNNVPHLGNIIGCVLSADVYARYSRQRGKDTLYVCGTDQYGTATQVKAHIQKMKPKEICDKYNAIHRDIYQWFDISFDIFGRTSQKQHQQIVQKIYLSLKQNGFISKKQIQQSYCKKCQFFLADRYISGTCPHCQYPQAKGDQCDNCGKLLSPQQLISSKCILCSQHPELQKTQHAFIELDKIQPNTQKWLIETMATNLWDQNAKAITKAWLKQGLKSRCITRDLKWGVPVPDMPNKVFYVWFDAPIGYISITKKALPETYKSWWHSKQIKLYQFMGKDNVPFHSVIFPSTCIGSNLDWTLVHKMSTTQYLNYEDGKFSKSNGVGVFGDNVQSLNIPPQVWRYYLLVNRPEKADTQFTWDDFVAKNNNQLLPNLGNLCNRILKQIYKLEYGIPDPKEFYEIDNKLIQDINKNFREYCNKMDQIQIKQSLKISMEISGIVNKYIQDTKPWQTQVKESGRNLTILFIASQILKFLSVIFQPFMPGFSLKLNYLLGQQKQKPKNKFIIKQLYIASEQGHFKECFLQLIESKQRIPQPILIFRQFQTKMIQEWRNLFKGKNQ